MSDDDFGTDSEGIKNLRSEHRKQAETISTLQQELEGFRAAQREATVKEALKAKGLPEKVASLYSGDASEDAVSKWVSDYADVFGVKAPAQDDANAQAAAQVAAASYGGSGFGDGEPALGSTGQVHGDPNELLKLIKTLPYEELVKRGLMPDPRTDMFNRPGNKF